jgi:hypothetical protein
MGSLARRAGETKDGGRRCRARDLEPPRQARAINAFRLFEDAP